MVVWAYHWDSLKSFFLCFDDLDLIFKGTSYLKLSNLSPKVLVCMIIFVTSPVLIILLPKFFNLNFLFTQRSVHCVPIFAIFGLNLNSLYRYKMILKLFCDNFSHSFRYSYMYHSVLLSI